MKEETQSVRINKKVAQALKIHVAKNGGTMKRLLEAGALYAMDKSTKKDVLKMKK